MIDLATRRAPAIRSPHDSDRLVRAWLWSVAALVVAMVLVGGATRLTGSGLSITEWQPIMGAVPPLDHAAWLEAFDKYRLTPQYRLLNKGMSLAEFQVIFWWEWAHRLLGRLIGLAFAVPLVLFWVSGRLARELRWPLVGLLALGGLQGAVGWYMVQSGLTGDMIAVSPVRLAFHLTMAIVILGLLTWIALGIGARTSSGPHLRTTRRSQSASSAVLVGLILAQIVAGGLVAGTKAGLTYNTWPLMDGRLVPAGLLTLSPWPLNLIENVTTVQFNHRMLAYVVVALALWHAAGVWRRADDPAQRASAVTLGLALIAQMGTGIWTLLSVTDAAIPPTLGILHQVGAALIFMIAVWHLRTMLVRPGMLGHE